MLSRLFGTGAVAKAIEVGGVLLAVTAAVKCCDFSDIIVVYVVTTFGNTCCVHRPHTTSFSTFPLSLLTQTFPICHVWLIWRNVIVVWDFGSERVIQTKKTKRKKTLNLPIFSGRQYSASFPVAPTTISAYEDTFLTWCICDDIKHVSRSVCLSVCMSPRNLQRQQQTKKTNRGNNLNNMVASFCSILQ